MTREERLSFVVDLIGDTRRMNPDKRLSDVLAARKIVDRWESDIRDQEQGAGVDTSALEGDPILGIARREYARYGGVDWGGASLEDRRYFIAEATRRWIEEGGR